MTIQGDQPDSYSRSPDSGQANDALFLQTLQRFEQAAAVCGGPAVRRFRIAGRNVELHFAGEQLLELLTPPLGHLAVSEAGERPFIVRLWDTASTRVKPPASPWTSDQYGPRGDIQYGLSRRLRASYSVDARMLSLFDTASGHAVCWVHDPKSLPPWDLAAPLRPILAWWASATNGQLTHGAAVGDRGAAVLLTAIGGSGKSTTALTCLDSGLSYLGDDYVMLRNGDRPMVCSLYSTAKLTLDHMRQVLPHFEVLATHIVSNPEEKVTLQLYDSHAAQLVPMLPLCAILVTEVASDGRAALVPIPRSEALKALAPSTIFQLPGAGAREFTRMASIVRSVSCYRLRLGVDAAANVGAVRRVIETST